MKCLPADNQENNGPAMEINPLVIVYTFPRTLKIKNNVLLNVST